MHVCCFQFLVVFTLMDKGLCVCNVNNLFPLGKSPELLCYMKETQPLLPFGFFPAFGGRRRQALRREAISASSSIKKTLGNTGKGRVSNGWRFLGTV